MQIHKIELQGLPNTRDLGGFPAQQGKTVKPHRLIRSGELFTSTPEDRRRLQEEFDLRLVVDFRTPGEQRERPDPAVPGAVYRSHPILKDEMMGVTREQKADQDVLSMLLQQLDNPSFSAEAYMASLYERLVQNAFSRGQYRAFFQMLLEQEQGAVLWHCTAGKDRVGTGTALLLSALGTDRQVILQDFMMTNEFMTNTTKAQMAAVEKATGSRKAAEQLGVLFSVRESYLTALFDAIDREFGGIDAFLEREMDLTDARRQRLLELYTA